MQSTVELTKTFAALADPTRISLVAALARGEATVGELARPFDLSQQAVSKHLKVLEDAGLISRRKVAQSRPCRLERQRLDTAIGWIEDQRQMWVDRHDRLEAHLLGGRDD
ncbi:metalloregulator ArsR/SmtB family transcription factor [Aeromicrobium sp.]|uniref:ArsR/SmtB family transcription factor n=1 Tax=Aeromicrobium sp. TaxID=1871063 RepID=UPI0030BB22C5